MGLAWRRDSSHAFHGRCSPRWVMVCIQSQSGGARALDSVKHARVESLKSLSCCMLLHSIERKRKRQLANNLVLLAPLGTHTHTHKHARKRTVHSHVHAHTAHTLKGAFKVTCSSAATLTSSSSNQRSVAACGKQAERGMVGGRALGGGLAVTEESHGQVLDMGGPLGGQLEELHVVPLHAIDGHWRGEENKAG